MPLYLITSLYDEGSRPTSSAWWKPTLPSLLLPSYARPSRLVSRSELTFRIHPPVVLIVEVKRSLHRCLSHCLVEMAAASEFNGNDEPVYGVLTTGLEWQFLKLEGKVVTLEQRVYALEPIEQVAGILTAMME